MEMRKSLLFVLALTIPASAEAQLPQPPGTVSDSTLELGRTLFTMNFARPEAERLTRRQGNGLGPLFNETSCVGCHSQGGVGGAGRLDRNVQLAGIVVDPPPSGSVTQILKTAREVHPAFDDATPVVFVQRSSTGDRETAAAYDRWRDDFLAGFDGDENSVLPRRRVHNGVTIELVERNTPALWGAGEIERLREAGGDTIRRRLAEEITAKKPWITGRAPVTADGEDGWYGWRGQIASLAGIVRGACASEMGLQVPGADEAKSPVAPPSRPVRREKRERSVDLDEEQVVALASFVSSLPRPTREVASYDADSVHRGERLFSNVGCADCHVPDLGSVKGMYSDHLLHDMGPSLADVQSATPQMAVVSQTRLIRSTIFNGRVAGGGGYNSGMSLSSQISIPVTQSSVTVIPTRRSMEWKTPPLWGVRDSYPYLHDGRAPTLDDAIRMHGGEGEKSALEFRRLKEDDQRAVLSFLESLTAPEPEQAMARK
jgi:CxxC motif-containing protein (DUF1111 family)